MNKLRLLAASVVLTAAGLGAPEFAIAATSGAPSPQSSPKQPDAKAADLAEPNKEPGAPDDSASARNAARTRMRECGHQWSAMKKSGAASGMTWKDFSQGCLARK